MFSTAIVASVRLFEPAKNTVYDKPLLAATSLVYRCAFGRHTTQKCLVIVLSKNNA